MSSDAGMRNLTPTSEVAEELAGKWLAGDHLSPNELQIWEQLRMNYPDFASEMDDLAQISMALCEFPLGFFEESPGQISEIADAASGRSLRSRRLALVALVAAGVAGIALPVAVQSSGQSTNIQTPTLSAPSITPPSRGPEGGAIFGIGTNPASGAFMQASVRESVPRRYSWQKVPRPRTEVSVSVANLPSDKPLWLYATSKEGRDELIIQFHLPRGSESTKEVVGRTALRPGDISWLTIRDERDVPLVRVAAYSVRKTHPATTEDPHSSE